MLELCNRRRGYYATYFVYFNLLCLHRISIQSMSEMFAYYCSRITYIEPHLATKTNSLKRFCTARKRPVYRAVRHLNTPNPSGHALRQVVLTQLPHQLLQLNELLNTFQSIRLFSNKKIYFYHIVFFKYSFLIRIGFNPCLWDRLIRLFCTIFLN